MPTFKTEALRIVSNVQLVKGFSCKINGKYNIILTSRTKAILRNQGRRPLDGARLV